MVRKEGVRLDQITRRHSGRTDLMIWWQSVDLVCSVNLNLMARTESMWPNYNGEPRTHLPVIMVRSDNGHTCLDPSFIAACARVCVRVCARACVRACDTTIDIISTELSNLRMGKIKLNSAVIRLKF